TAPNGCENTASSTITKNVELPNVSVAPTEFELNCTTPSKELTASSSTAGVTYKWNDASETTGATLTVTEAGTYTVTATAPNGCENTASSTITKNVSKPAAPISLGDKEYCDGDVVPTLAVQAPAETNYKVQWYNSSDENVAEGATYTPTEPTVGSTDTYYAEMLDTENGCVSETKTAVSITRNAVPEITFTVYDASTGTELTAPYVVNCNVPQVKVKLESDQATATFKWSDDNTDAERYFETETNLDVIAISEKGCESGSTTVSIEENKVDPVMSVTSVNASGVSTKVLNCNDTELTLTATVEEDEKVGECDYKWTYTGAISTDNPLMVSLPDTYEVVATSKINGCTDEKSIKITQDIEQPLVEMYVPTDTLSCKDDSQTTTLTATSIPDGCAFEWSDGVSTQIALSYHVDHEGTYSVVAIGPNGCRSEVADTTIVERKQIPEIEITASAEKVTCNSVILTASSDSKGMTYVWSDKLGTEGANLEVSEAGTYTVTGTNRYGCVNTKDFNIEEDKTAPIVKIEPNSGTLTCTNPEIEVEAQVTNVDDVTYLWNGGKSVSTAKNTFDTKGTYTVTVTNNETNCKGSASVTLNENKQEPFLAMTPLDPVCLPATVDISNAVGAASVYDDIKYFYDAQATQEMETTIVDVETKRAYYVQAYGVEGSGCQGQIKTIWIEVKDVTSAPSVVDYDKCVTTTPQSLKNQVNISDKSGLKFYDDAQGDIPISDMFNASVENYNHTYYVTNTENGKCESSTVAINVHVEGTIDIDIEASDTEVLAAQKEVEVTAVPLKEFAISEYKWKKNALVLDEETGPSVSSVLYTNTKYTVTATGRCNAVTKEIDIKVLWPTLITPRQGANGYFAKGLDIVVYNRFNEKIFTGSDGWDGSINCSNLAPKGEIALPGVYYYYITLPDGGIHKGTIEVVKF
ncbi:MAG: hypothetical protein MJ003_06690, partial [Paludibacteraceae bacterium]|nr:hypothetical protein [Paludibacteraceae bacterium]